MFSRQNLLLMFKRERTVSNTAFGRTIVLVQHCKSKPANGCFSKMRDNLPRAASLMFVQIWPFCCPWFLRQKVSMFWFFFDLTQIKFLNNYGSLMHVSSFFDGTVLVFGKFGIRCSRIFFFSWSFLLEAYLGSFRCIIGRSVSLFCTQFQPQSAIFLRLLSFLFSSKWIEACTEKSESNRDLLVRFIVQVSNPWIEDAWNFVFFIHLLKICFSFSSLRSFWNWLRPFSTAKHPTVMLNLEFTALQQWRPHNQNEGTMPISRMRIPIFFSSLLSSPQNIPHMPFSVFQILS